MTDILTSKINEINIRRLGRCSVERNCRTLKLNFETSDPTVVRTKNINICDVAIPSAGYIQRHT